MKKTFLVLILACLLVALVACGSDEVTTAEGTSTTMPVDTATTPADTTTTPADTEAPGGISETEWNGMLSDEMFENYTFVMEGEMTVTQNGEVQSTSDVKERIKIASDKISIELFAADTDSEATDSEAMVFDGEYAAALKLQYTEIFVPLLQKYDSFVYDANTKTYKVTETVTIDTVLTGINFYEDESFEMFDLPATIEMREGEVMLSDDGKLLTFVCDYTQTMNMGGGAIATSGITTWTFSDFGTTVIE